MNTRNRRVAMLIIFFGKHFIFVENDLTTLSFGFSSSYYFQVFMTILKSRGQTLVMQNKYCPFGFILYSEFRHISF